MDTIKVIDSRHPWYHSWYTDWEEWRLTYKGGKAFRDRYLTKFSNRESTPDFTQRRDMTPTPSYAKAAINDIRNSIFQRMRDIIRRGGSDAYQKAINGLSGGVDRRGSTMNAFLGMQVLSDLLVMGRIGVFVDNSAELSNTLAGRQPSPYLYAYQVEDILSWSYMLPEEPSQFKSIMLRDSCINYDAKTLLPTQTYKRIRLLWVDDVTGKVNVQFYNEEGEEEGPPRALELERIPFVMLDIGESLIDGVCQHQKALLNLSSSDVNFAVKANFPVWVEQRDPREIGAHLKHSASEDGTATAGGQGAADRDARVGVSQGIAYDMNSNPPQWIHPSPDPLEVSLKLQDKLEQDIRKLVNLAVLNLATRASAESKSLDNQGLEAGLSFIGLVMENAERQVAEYWAAYEERTASSRQVATIKYPDRYSLKSDVDRIDESTKLSKLVYAVPSRTAKREIGKNVVDTLLGGKVPPDVLKTINEEIDKADYTTSDPETIIKASERGLVSDQTASQALGFDEDEYVQAQKDHGERARRVAEAQASAKSTSDMGARGVPDLSANPNAGEDEKAQSRDTTLSYDPADKTRGKGRFTE